MSYDSRNRLASHTYSGAIAYRERYTPFGTALVNPASNDNQAGFTGHIKDSATGLTYMQARYYDPLIGRFQTPSASACHGMLIYNAIPEAI